MDPASEAKSPDKLDTKPSFRKPSSDAANRKYRRHSPVKESDSSSSDGSPKHERSHSPLNLRKDRSRISDDQRKRDVERELERDSYRNQSSRGYDSRHSEKQSHGSFRDIRRYDDYSRHHRYEDEKNYQRPSRSGRESRYDSRSEYVKSSRVSDRADSGSRQVGSRRDSDRTEEQDKHRSRESHGDRRDRQRSPGVHQNDCVISHEELRGYGKDSSRVTDGGGRRLKENETSNKIVDGRDDQTQKRKRDEWDDDKVKDKYVRERDEGTHSERRNMFSSRERDGRNDKFVDKTSKFSDREAFSSTNLKSGHLEIGNAMEKPSSLQQLKDLHDNVNSEIMSSTNNDGESANSVDAAKVAALKAAELVNKNLVGFGGVGCLSADQKKKILWGNKKNTSAEESSVRWDLNAFSDKERQEKFNKLMGVKGNVAPDPRTDHKDGNVEAKKREELEMDLEKQYTAGLRRRDGRTVGLGL